MTIFDWVRRNSRDWIMFGLHLSCATAGDLLGHILTCREQFK